MLHLIDWLILIIFFIIVLSIGLITSKRAGKNTAEFFLSGRNMPWWLLGVSMVACTFSADTPNLVTDIVRTNGVAGNWAWWAFLFTGMLTVFVYSKLWRRSKVMTDLEFYEIRYSGKLAAFLRGFRSIYPLSKLARLCLVWINIQLLYWHHSRWLYMLLQEDYAVLFLRIFFSSVLRWSELWQQRLLQ
jgi:Na+(H+)/acetate symporter ActP